MRWTALLVCLATLSCAAQGPALRPHAGDEEELLERHRGQVVVLSFWAIWCPPCMRELPALVRLAAEHEGRVVFRAVYNEVASERVRFDLSRWLERNQEWLRAGGRFEQYIYFGNEALHRQFPRAGIPMTYVLDAEGGVVEKIQGVELEKNADGTHRVKDDKLRAAVARALGRAPPSSGPRR